jgi:hypothetical protein
MNDNAILNTILSAINAHIDARVKAILDSRPAPEVPQATQTVVQPDAAFLAQMNAVIREHVNAAMHEEMEAHLANANHLTPDDIEECIGSYDFSDIVDDHIENHDFDYSDIAEKVQDHLNLRDEIAELLTEATIRLG